MAEGVLENIILVCEDSLEGILTAIYEAYALRLPHEQILLQVGQEENLRLFASYREVQPDREKAEKVMSTLRKRFGEKDYYALCLALTTTAPEKAQAVYRTVVWGLACRRQGSILSHLVDDNVRRVMELSREALNELHHFREFLRFRELDGGGLYAVIKAKCNILTMLTMHFADRLPMENFLIYDEERELYAVHPAGKEWFLMEGQKGEGIELAEEELYYQELFRHFCHNISIEGRKNLKLQRNMLPLRFRPYMVEFPEK